METTFLACAAAGGTILLCQLLAGLFGFGGDHDTDHDTTTDHDTDDGGSSLLGALSVRSVSAALMFFGLGGMTALYYGAEEPAALAAAFGAAAAALYAVIAIMRALAGLKHDGTARVERSVGRTGTVYLRVPAARAGSGKVQVSVQNRTVEYEAVTAGIELATGTPIKIVAVVTPSTVEVEPA